MAWTLLENQWNRNQKGRPDLPRAALRVWKLIWCLIGLAIISNCGYVTPSDTDQFVLSSAYSTAPTYDEINQKIIQPKCITCHSSQPPNLSTYALMMASG